MSKSRGNIVNPDDVIDQYGADAFRCYEMFMGPLEQMKPWSMRGVEGVARFLARVWRLMMRENQAGAWELSPAVQDVDLIKAQQKVMHATIKKVSEDIETLSFNTAISQMMIFVNAFTNAESIPVSAMRAFLILLNPFAPHVTSELWEKVNARFKDVRGDITDQKWPACDEQLLVEDEIEMAVQADGRLVGVINVSVSATDKEVEEIARALPKVPKSYLKTIVVSKKVINFVTR
jgi:leucyl-tRNA synthetase